MRNNLYHRLCRGRSLRTLVAATGAVAVCSGGAALAAPAADAAPPPVHIYWANGFGNTIGESNLDGSDANPSFITGADNPTGVAVADGHIYWSNQNADTIGRANLDGTGVDQDFVTGASAPGQMAVHAGRIYWCNVRTGAIDEADLNGTRVNEDLISGTACGGVAVNDQQIYWTTIGFGQIEEANLDGTDVNAKLHPEPVLLRTRGHQPASTVDADIQTGPQTFVPNLAESNLDGSEMNENLLSGVSAGALAVSPSATTPAYRFRAIDDTKDLTFNQVLGISRDGVIAGYFGSGAQGHPNQGYIVSPRYPQPDFMDENYPGSAQTQVTGLNDLGVTVGFGSSQNTASAVNDNFGF